MITNYVHDYIGLHL